MKYITFFSRQLVLRLLFLYITVTLFIGSIIYFVNK